MLREAMALVENDVTTVPEVIRHLVRQLTSRRPTGAARTAHLSHRPERPPCRDSHIAAIDTSEPTVEGFQKAETIGDARSALIDLHLYPVKIEEKKGALSFELTQEKGEEEGADAVHAFSWRCS